MGTPFEFGLVANTLKEHRWFFNMQLLTGHGYVPTIMPEASLLISLFITTSLLLFALFDFLVCLSDGSIVKNIAVGCSQPLYISD